MQNEICLYWEITNGNFKYYELADKESNSAWSGYYATYSNGVLTTPSNCYWRVAIEGKYTIEGDALYMSDVLICHITKISENKGRIFDSEWLSEGIIERISTFK